MQANVSSCCIILLHDVHFIVYTILLFTYWLTVVIYRMIKNTEKSSTYICYFLKCIGKYCGKDINILIYFILFEISRL